VLKTIIRETETRTIFMGVVPFVAMDIVRILLLLAVPALALAIPRTM
jgi:C4-dicarboxylate transporter DctM subunit